jgi:hypothetical protein
VQDVSVEASGGSALGGKKDEFDGFTFIEKPSALAEEQEVLTPVGEYGNGAP